MTRPLRIEFPGALYHVTSRGNRRNAIYRDDTDRYIWLDIIAQVCERFNFKVHAYCQMTNHYHVMLETVDGNLSRGMKQLNAIFSQRVNQRHKSVGHVFQGRYHAVLVQKEAHLLELARYIVLNPVRAGLVSFPEEWHWTSYHAMIDHQPAPPWLETKWLLEQFPTASGCAAESYRLFVSAGFGAESPLQHTRHQLLLGDDRFASQQRENKATEEMAAVAKEQRRIGALTLAEYAAGLPARDEAMARAYWSTAYTMLQFNGLRDRQVNSTNERGMS